jgi:hypothetical protein
MLLFSGFSSSPPRRGVSLLELILAFALFAVAFLAFFQMMRAGGTRTVATSHSLAANRVALKVMADLQEQARLTGGLLELVTEFPDLQTTDPIVDAQSVFFRHIADRQPPWGIMDPATDGGVVSTDGPLFEHLRPFRVGATLQRAGGSDVWRRQLAEVSVRVQWDEAGGPTRAYSLETVIPSPQGPRPRPHLTLIDEGTADDVTRRRFYPDLTGMNLAQAVGHRGGDLDLIRRLGRLAMGTDALLGGLASMAVRLQQARQQRQTALTGPGQPLIKVQLRIAALHEAMAAACFLGCERLASPTREIITTFRVSELGGLAPAAALVGLRDYQAALAYLEPSVRQATLEYEWLLAEGLLDIRTPRVEDFSRIKSLEGWRLLSLIDAGNVPAYRSFVSRLKLTVDGRNPAWERAMVREVRLSQDPARLATVFANLADIYDVYRHTLKPLAETALELARTFSRP